MTVFKPFTSSSCKHNLKRKNMNSKATFRLKSFNVYNKTKVSLLMFTSGLIAVRHHAGNGAMFSKLLSPYNTKDFTSMWHSLLWSYLLRDQCSIIRFLYISKLLYQSCGSKTYFTSLHLKRACNFLVVFFQFKDYHLSRTKSVDCMKTSKVFVAEQLRIYFSFQL